MNYLEKLGKLFAYHSCPTLSAASVGCRCRYLRCQNIGLIYNNGYYNYKLYCIDHYHKHMGSNIFLSPNCRCGTPCSQPIVRMGMCYDHIKCTSECCQYIGCINLPERYQANRITGRSE